MNREKDESGEPKADFIRIRAIGRTAGICREYLRKGRKVGITGALQTYTYTDSEGRKLTGFEVFTNDVTLLYSGDPNRTEHGDIHADDGTVHHPVLENFTIDDMDDNELPY